MLASDAFRLLLWDELTAAGLVSVDGSGHAYQTLRAEISRRGSVERDRIVGVVGRGTWRRAVSTLGRAAPEEDCIRVLGFGSALTEFAVAPLGLARPGADFVCALGALANLIVSLYDNWLDLGFRPAVVLPRSFLQAIADSRPWVRPCARVSAAVTLSPQRLFMMRLVAQYFSRLDALPYASRRRAVRDFATRAVARMYDAELETLRTPQMGCRARSLRRKASLPFVVLGVPAWLVVERQPSVGLGWHIRWLYRLGEFIGWIDDANDLREDLEAGRPSLLARELATAKGCRLHEAALARRVAALGAQVLLEWRQAVPDDAVVPTIAAHALPVCLSSWFAGHAMAARSV